MEREQEIRGFALNLGIDDIGFARAGDYQSPRSLPLARFMPGAKSLVVMTFKVLSSCESPDMPMADNGLDDMFAFIRAASYRMGRFLESKYRAKVVTTPDAFPFTLSDDRKGLADFSQRHAALAAGQGSWGRNNLILHPRYGCRVNFTTIITDLELKPSPKCEDLCNNCGLCVANCPVDALDEEGKTDTPKCYKYCQPYGTPTEVDFWTKFIDSSKEEQKEMLKSEEFSRLRATLGLGMTHECFNCIALCPIGEER